MTGDDAPDDPDSRSSDDSAESGKAAEKKPRNEGGNNGGDENHTSSDADNSPKTTPNETRGAKRAASSGPSRPWFQLPFECGQSWELTTYAEHNPEESKVDFYSDGGTTEGAQVVASAGGTVMKLPDPGGVKIDHGGGWYTLFIHMEDIQVEVGQEVQQGDPIGHVGSVGTDSPHLHYEQLYNPDGEQAYTDSDIRLPKFDGQKVRLSEDGNDPTMTSKNSCS